MTEQIKQQADATGGAETLDPKFHSEAEAVGEQAGVQEESTRPSNHASLQEELEAARQEAAQAQDKYLRARAEMENFRKRLERTYADRTRSARKELLTKLLGVKDNIDRALHYGEQSQGGEGIIEGVRLTRYQLDQVLEQEGVHRIEAEGKPFDPRLEEAVQSVDDPTVPDHTVVKVVRNGYTYGDNDEVLRPAQVIVSVHESEE